MPIVVNVQPPQLPPKNITDIPNATFFHGSIGDLQGPFFKMGSIGTKVWIVVRLSCPEGIVWSSGRDEKALVHGYEPIAVKEMMLITRGTI